MIHVRVLVQVLQEEGRAAFLFHLVTSGTAVMLIVFLLYFGGIRRFLPQKRGGKRPSHQPHGFLRCLFYHGSGQVSTLSFTRICKADERGIAFRFEWGYNTPCEKEISVRFRPTERSCRDLGGLLCSTETSRKWRKSSTL